MHRGCTNHDKKELKYHYTVHCRHLLYQKYIANIILWYELLVFLSITNRVILVQPKSFVYWPFVMYQHLKIAQIKFTVFTIYFFCILLFAPDHNCKKLTIETCQNFQYTVFCLFLQFSRHLVYYKHNFVFFYTLEPSFPIPDNHYLLEYKKIVKWPNLTNWFKSNR